MTRTYNLEHGMNKSKQKQVLLLLAEYRATCGKIAKYQWREFFEKGELFNKFCAVKHVDSKLSERFKRNCAYQTTASLKSFLSNVENRFRDIVNGSELGAETKKHLYQINRRNLWLVKEHDIFSADELRLAHKIFKNILGWWRKPRFRNANMVLNESVAKISVADKLQTPEFDFWVKLSTLDKGKPIQVPLKSNKYFASKKGVLCQSIQINCKDSKTLKVCLVKEVEPRAIAFKYDKIAIDIGMKNLFALNTGELLGLGLFERLKKQDKIITSLGANRQRQGFKTKSKKYNRQVSNLREFLNNEIRRVINRLLEVHAPHEIVMEKLDFRSPDLSKKFNRLISNLGKKIIEQKLAEVAEEYKIKITKVNPAYTSQTCDSCGYVDKRNRKTRDKFECKCCNKKLHADVVASRNILARSSCSGFGVNLHKKTILRELVIGFTKRLPSPCSWANRLLSENPYFLNEVRQI